jgi:class 3 adenylate cyclase
MARKALLIGVPEYDLPGADLPAVRKDLQILGEALVSSGYHIDRLGEDKTYPATRSRIHQRMRRFFADAGEGDLLFLYFSGHGVNLNRKDYLVPADATLADRGAVEEYLIPVDISHLIGLSKAQTILFFIDACRRGMELVDPSFPKEVPFAEWSQGEQRPVQDREYATVFSCGPGQVSRCDEHNVVSYFTDALAHVLHAQHPARRFRDVNTALQAHLESRIAADGCPKQTVRLRIDSGPSGQLMETEISGDPKARESQGGQPSMPEIADRGISARFYLEQPKESHNPPVHACVLSARLFGVTEFQMEHTLDETLWKTILHNSVVSEIIANAHGLVVKHARDRVVGVFGGDNCEENAVEAGVAILGRMREESASRHLDFPYDLSTSIGVESGDVWRFSFDQHKVEDWLGTAVNTAAWLCSLAAGQQLICSEGVYREIDYPNSRWSWSDPVDRFVEGLIDPLSVRLVAPSGCPSRSDDIPLSGFVRPISDAVRTKLNEGRSLMREKRFDEAFRLYRGIHDVDRANFEANVCCAEIELDRLSGDRTNRFEALDSVIHEYLCRAKLIRPDSCRVWRLLGWAYYLQAIDVRSTSLLSTAIERAKLSLRYAQDHMDVNAEAQARILLAEILRELARLDRAQRPDALARANECCGEVASQVVSSLDRTRSNRLAIHALIQADLGEEPAKVEKLLEEARAGDPKNPRVHQALAEFYQAHPAYARATI